MTAFAAGVQSSVVMNQNLRFGYPKVAGFPALRPA